MRPVLVTQHGYSIPELMVAMALGLVVVGAVFLSYAGTVVAARQQSAAGEMTESALLALSLMRRDLQMAAYVHPQSITADRFEPLDPLVRARPVFGCRHGFLAVKAPVGSGVCGAGTIRSDAIEINFEATFHSVDRDGTNRLTDCRGAALDDPAAAGVPAGPADAGSRLANTHRYFVETQGATGIPHLYCASAQSTMQPLVPNVEILQITYAVAAGWDPQVPGTQRPVRYVQASDVGSGGWDDIVAVQLCVLMRSEAPVLSPDELQTHTYIDCEGTSKTSSDRHLRRAFTTSVGLRNRELR